MKPKPFDAEAAECDRLVALVKARSAKPTASTTTSAERYVAAVETAIRTAVEPLKRELATERAENEALRRRVAALEHSHVNPTPYVIDLDDVNTFERFCSDLRRDGLTPEKIGEVIDAVARYSSPSNPPPVASPAPAARVH